MHVSASSRRYAVALAMAGGAATIAGAAVHGNNPETSKDRRDRPAAACRAAPLSEARQLSLRLESGAFPGSPNPDVELHIPAGFDATRHPGIVVYFHGWMGCAAAALAPKETPCRAGGEPRRPSGIAMQADAAGVNAAVVAVELRADMPTGEPGQLAMPGALRRLLNDVLSQGIAPATGCPVDIEQVDRVVVIAHSGGYQAAAAAIAAGDVPQIREVVLLDALYGADEVFGRWVRDDATGFAPDAPAASRLRWVDLYTCCGGTADGSKALAQSLAPSLSAAGASVTLDDGPGDLAPAMLDQSVVFKRVPRAHEELPRAYVQAIMKAAGFLPIRRAEGG
ncbi:MAG: hypothetical protein FWD17_01995 [Polyangiaceae bacterium]|nr:hypothetical protein [Polyangiaceae bacterium]